jgi:hypothetical protein
MSSWSRRLCVHVCTHQTATTISPSPLPPHPHLFARQLASLARRYGEKKRAELARVPGGDFAAYDRPDMAYARKTFIQPQVMVHDRSVSSRLPYTPLLCHTEHLCRSRRVCHVAAVDWGQSFVVDWGQSDGAMERDVGFVPFAISRHPPPPPPIPAHASSLCAQLCH